MPYCSWPILLTTVFLIGFPAGSYPQDSRSISTLLAQDKPNVPATIDDGAKNTPKLDLEQAIPASDDTKRFALVIGNSSYRRLQTLNNPRNDAADICAKLQTLKFEVQCKNDIPSRNEFQRTISNFSTKISPGTTVFFYYAGHGVQINGENYLLPTSLDASTAADVEDEGLSLSFIFRMFEEARSSPNIVVLDACRTNPFPRKISGVSSKGLARVEPPIGTILVYATSPNGVALDGEGRNGLFTKHLLENLSKPGHKLDELFQLVSKGVEDEARKHYQFEQTPYRSSSYSGAYCLAGCDNPLVALQIEQFKKLSEEAARRVQTLSDENAQLRRKFEGSDSYVRDLESKISRLTNDESNTSVKELSRLRSALDGVRKDQQAVEKQRAEYAERDREIAALKDKVSAFDYKAQQLEEYRKQVQELQKENAEKTSLLNQKASPSAGTKPIVIPSF
jgi:hypothetical protein